MTLAESIMNQLRTAEPKTTGDGETWQNYLVVERGDLPLNADDRRALERELREELGYRLQDGDFRGITLPIDGEPGRVYVKRATVSVSASRVLVSQRCGLDV